MTGFSSILAVGLTVATTSPAGPSEDEAVPSPTGEVSPAPPKTAPALLPTTSDSAVARPETDVSHSPAPQESTNGGAVQPEDHPTEAAPAIQTPNNVDISRVEHQRELEAVMREGRARVRATAATESDESGRGETAQRDERVILSQESAKQLEQDDPCAPQSDANGESGRFVLSGRFGRRSGLGLEYVTSGGVGLFLNLSADAHNDEADNRRSATRRLHSDWSIEHMIDVGFAVHLWPDSSWDPYLSAALSHLGYVVNTLGNDDEIVGGSLFPRLAVGLRWQWRYLHIGIEFGWYPYEAFRYDINRRPDTVVVYDLTDQDRWNARRFSTSWLVGLQF